MLHSSRLLLPSLPQSPPLPPLIYRNLAVIVCEFPAYFAPCLLFRIAGDGNWQRISTGVFNSPVSQKVHGLPTSTSTRSLQRKPRVFLRKEDFVSFWRDHVYGRGRRQRLCSLLRSTGQNIAVDAVRHPRNVGHPRDFYGSILDNAGRLCRHNSATRGSLDGDATLLVLVLRRRTPIAIRQLLGFGRDGCPRY